MRTLLRVFLVHTLAAVLIATPNTVSAQHPAVEASHEYMSRMYGGKPPSIPLIPYIGDVAQALALFTTSPALMRTLYSLSLMAHTVDGVAPVVAGLNPPPGGSKVASLISVAYGGLSMMNIPSDVKLLINAGALGALYESSPKLRKSLRRIGKKRLVNATLHLGIFLLTRVLVSWISQQTNVQNTEDNTVTNIALSMTIATILSNVLLDRESEELGIEEQLTAHAKRLISKRSQPFFSPPAMRDLPQKERRHRNLAPKVNLKPNEVAVAISADGPFQKMELDSSEENK